MNSLELERVGGSDLLAARTACGLPPRDIIDTPAPWISHRGRRSLRVWTEPFSAFAGAGAIPVVRLPQKRYTCPHASSTSAPLGTSPARGRSVRERGHTR